MAWLISSVMFMTDTQRSAFTRLLSTWKRHDELRRNQASVRDLAASRKLMDEARLEMWRVRIF